MLIPQAAVDIVERWEGFRAEPYLCPAGVPTIGYGSTRDIHGDRITLDHPSVDEAEAELMLLRAPGGLGDAVLSALTLCPCLMYEPEYRAAAVASFVYNLGAGRLKASTLRRKVNEQNWEAAEAEFHKWVWAGGRKLPGLVARRADEAALFMGYKE